MGDNGRIYLKLVKATLITIVMLGDHGRGTIDMLQGTMELSIGPLLALMPMVSRRQIIYISYISLS